jgi:hypothetical protein
MNLLKRAELCINKVAAEKNKKRQLTLQICQYYEGLPVKECLQRSPTGHIDV